MRSNTALAAIATTPATDPVFAAIERFNEAADAYWTAHIAAERRLRSRVWGTHQAVAHVAEAWQRSTVALANTRATTMAGVLALAELIADDCENIEVDFGEGAEALSLAGNLRASIETLTGLTP